MSNPISRKLSAIARKNSVPYEKVLTDFFLERLVVRLLRSAILNRVFVLKGGYVARRVYGSPRYTLDVDVLLQGVSIRSISDVIIQSVESDIGDFTCFKFQETEDLLTQGEYPGIRYIFRAGLGNLPENYKIAQIVKLDIGVGDFAEVVAKNVLPLIDDQPMSWKVYEREVMVSEKIHAMLSRPLGNSRSKDLYDLMFHLPDCDLGKLNRAISATFTSRGDQVPESIVDSFRTLHTEILKRGWKSATAGINLEINFEEAFQAVIKILAKLK